MKLPAFVFSLCVTLVIAVAGCGGGDSSTSSSESTTAGESSESTGSTSTTPRSTEPAPTTVKTEPDVTVPKGVSPNRFAIRELEKGTGPSVKSDDTVTIHYVVLGYDSEREVDSSWGRSRIPSPSAPAKR